VTAFESYPNFMLWVDLEATGTPDGVDWTDVHILETAVIITDMALNKIKGVTDVIRMTPAAAEAIRKNPVVLDMHRKSGLLEESVKSPQARTLAAAEDEILNLLEDGEQYIIAGSGVAAYDHPLIKAKMPRLANRLVYYPFDVGVLRRASTILAGRPVVNPNMASYGPSKEHRALADIQGHLAEGESFRDYFRNAVVIEPTH